MPLTKQDLSDIRDVVLDALDVTVNPRLDRLEAQIDSLWQRMDKLETRIGSLESGQYETNRRLSSIETRLTDVEGKVTALHNDVIELYNMVGTLQHQVITDKKFKKLPTDKKLLVVHAELTTLGRHLNISLPKN